MAWRESTAIEKTMIRDSYGAADEIVAQNPSSASAIGRLMAEGFVGEFFAGDNVITFVRRRSQCMQWTFPPHFTMVLSSSLALAALLLSTYVDAFTLPVRSGGSTTVALNQHIGSGGMADTRNPDTYQDEDPRKSISAAPSFEEYLKQRAGEGTTAAVVAAPAPTPAPAAPSASVATDMDATAAIAAMETSQSKTVGEIAATIPDLAPKPDQSYIRSDGFNAMGNAVSLQASDAPGPANIAWISDLCVDGAMSSLTIFNGPLSDVPHLISRCFIKDGTLNFFLDVRPRGYGAYDLRDADGNYPGPGECK